VIPDHTVNLATNPDGTVNLQIGENWCHSRRDPQTEASRFVKKCLTEFESHTPRPRSVFVIGIGWGYHVPLFIEAFPEIELYFYEPIEAVHAVLEQTGRLEELSLSGANIVTDPAAVLRKQPLLFLFPFHRRTLPDQLEALLSATSRVDHATANRFTGLWIRNFVKRLVLKESFNFLTQIESSVPGGAALYCGAGPCAISELAPLIGQNRHPFFLIASDSAVAPLYRVGITPDLVLSIDSGYATLYHLKALLQLTRSRTLPSDLPFLTWSAGPLFLEQLGGSTLFYPTTFPFDQLCEGLYPIEPFLNRSRNQSGIALHLARIAGCSVLYTAGADGITNGVESHIPGNGYTLYALQNNSRTRPVESYRPRGYGPTLTEKNRVSLDGLARMADEFSIELRPISSHKTQFASECKRGEVSHTLSFRTLPTERLRTHLLRHQESIPFRQLENEGIHRFEEQTRRALRLLR